MKAMNALRCMANSGASSTWYLMAGSWLFLKYAGATDSIKPTVDDAYQYVCTCIYDVNGLKEMLGNSAESNAAFSSCSEKAKDEKVAAREEKAKFKAKQ